MKIVSDNRPYLNLVHSTLTNLTAETTLVLSEVETSFEKVSSYFDRFFKNGKRYSRYSLTVSTPGDVEKGDEAKIGDDK